MPLLSIAVSAAVIGVILMLTFCSLWLFYRQFNSNPLIIFYTGYRIEWENIFLFIFSNAITIWGVVTAVKIGYTHLDGVVVVLSAGVIFVITMVVYGILSKIKYPLIDRYERTLRKQLKAEKRKNNRSSKISRGPVLNDPFFNESVPMGVPDPIEETPEPRSSESH
jgi:hypothetical protein